MLRRLDEIGGEIASTFESLAAEATEAVAREGVDASPIIVRRRIASLRYVGQESTLMVDWEPSIDLRTGFEDRHSAIYGHRPAARLIEVESLRAIASTVVDDPPAAPDPSRTRRHQPPSAAPGWGARGRTSPCTSVSG